MKVHLNEEINRRVLKELIDKYPNLTLPIVESITKSQLEFIRKKIESFDTKSIMLKGFGKFVFSEKRYSHYKRHKENKEQSNGQQDKDS